MDLQGRVCGAERRERSDIIIHFIDLFYYFGGILNLQIFVQLKFNCRNFLFTSQPWRFLMTTIPCWLTTGKKSWHLKRACTSKCAAQYVLYLQIQACPLWDNLLLCNFVPLFFSGGSLSLKDYSTQAVLKRSLSYQLKSASLRPKRLKFNPQTNNCGSTVDKDFQHKQVPIYSRSLFLFPFSLVLIKWNEIQI